MTPTRIRDLNRRLNRLASITNTRTPVVERLAELKALTFLLSHRLKDHPEEHRLILEFLSTTSANFKRLQEADHRLTQAESMWKQAHDAAFDAVIDTYQDNKIGKQLAHLRELFPREIDQFRKKYSEFVRSDLGLG